MPGQSNDPFQPTPAPTDKPVLDFSQVDLDQLKLTPQTPVEEAYHQTIDHDPDHAAKVLSASRATGQPPEFVADNLDAAQKAAATPSSKFFADITAKYPASSKFLSDPENMAVAKDDIPNLTKTEQLVQDHNFGRDLYNDIWSGTAQFNKFLSGIPNAAGAVVMYPWNKTVDILGHPEKQYTPDVPWTAAAMKYWGDIADKYRPDINNVKILDAIKTGDPKFIAKVAISNTIESAPTLGAYYALSLLGAGPVQAYAALSSGTEAYTRNREMGINPADATANAIYHGGVNAAFMGLGKLSPAHLWENALAPSLGPVTARKVALEMIKTVAGASLNLGAIMGGISLADQTIDNTTGVAKTSPSMILQNTLNSALGGMFTGGLLGIPAATLGGYAKMQDIGKVHPAWSYSEIGKAITESKLPGRSPEAHQKFLSNLGMPDVVVPAKAFETYFQSKDIDPKEMAKKLGVQDQLAEAANRGGDISVPFQDWAGELAKTPHYDGLKPDIRWYEDKPTLNEAKTGAEVVAKQMEDMVKSAADANPGWEEGRQQVVDQIAQQLAESKAYPQKDIATHAETAAKYIESLAAINKEKSPADYLAKNPIEIKGGQITPKPADLFQAEHETVNPIDRTLPQEEKVKALQALSKENEPLVSDLIKEVDRDLESKSKLSFKKPENILNKANRPSIKAEKPWFDVEHVRDALRFKSEISNLNDFGAVVQKVLDRGWQIIKLDTGKIENPKEWGWRFAGMDIRMPNGQIVEYYMHPHELGGDVKDANHLLFEKWRHTTNEYRTQHYEDYLNDLRTSKNAYDKQWGLYLDRVGLGESEAFASWRNLSASLESLTRSKLSLRSSAENVPTFQEPFTSIPGTSNPSPLSGSTITRPEAGSLVTNIGVTSNKSIAPGGENVKPQVSFESSPGPKTGYLEGELTAPESQRLDFHRDMIKTLFPNGEDEIANTLGIKAPKLIENVGYFKGEDGVMRASPGTQAVFDKDTSPETIRDYANILGYALKQEAMGTDVPRLVDKMADTDGIAILIGRTPLDEETKALYNLINNPGICITSSEDGFHVRNFTESPAEITNFEFHKLVTEAVEKVKIEGDLRFEYYKNNGEYIKGGTNGENYLTHFNDRPELTATAQRVLDPLVQQVHERAAEKFGWKNPFRAGSEPTEPTKLNQEEPAGPGGDPTISPRASISFLPDKAVISIHSADPVSLIHEMSHYWLKNFFAFVQSGKAEQQHLDQWDVLKKWLGVQEGQTELTREQQEKFAKGNEKYIFDGKAPSESLRGPFLRFRAWLLNFYKDPELMKNVVLPDDVRKVMDRIFASEDEIRFAEKQSGSDFADYAKLNLDPKVMARLGALREQAHDAAFQELFQKQMEEISADNQRKLVNEAAQARVKADADVRSSETQQSINAVEKTFKSDPVKTSQDFWLKKMDAAKRAQFEQLAESRGYSCGDEMAQKIIQEPSVQQQVDAYVNQHMAQFADLKDTDKIKEAAMAAVRNEKSTELMANEAYIFQNLVDEAKGRVFNQKVREAQAKIEAEAAKANAQRTVLFTPVSEAGKFMRYFTAERNAALRVKKALLDGDYEEAAKAKREQMLNHALVRESYAFKQELATSMRFFDRFASRGKDLKDIPYGFMRQIDTLLADHGLAKPRPEDAETYLTVAKSMQSAGEEPAEIAHRTGWTVDDAGSWKQESLADTIKRIQDDYRNLDIPESVVTQPGTNYKDMKVGYFRDLKNAVKAINAVGRGYDNFLDENIKMDRKEAAAKFRADIEANLGKPYYESRLPGSRHDETMFNRTSDLFDKARGILTPSLVNLYSYCMHLSHGDNDGMAMNLIYRPLEHALNAELDGKTKEVAAMRKIISDHFTPEEYAKQKTEKVYIKSLDRDFTLDQIQAFANNWGTLTGRERATNLIDGSKMTLEQTREILSHVTKEMWDYAQAVWDHNDSHWAEIVALQEKVAGESPQKVKAAPVETPFGTYPGGYYPLKYDRSKSDEAIKTIDERNAIYKTQSPVAAHTEHGFTQSRVAAYGQPISLDTRAEYTHLDNVVHDLTHRQAVIDVSAFLRQRDTREAIINSIGRDGYDTIMGHVKWVAADQGDYLNGLSDKLLQRLRLGGTVAVLGLRPATAPIFLASNAITAVKQLGPLGFGHAITDFLANREENVQFINDLIPAMEHRSTLMDRDLNDLDKSLQGEKRLMSHLLFYPHQKADQAISYPLALYTYKQNLAEFGKQKAADMAYEAVTSMAGDGSTLGQAMIQRGSPSQKMWAWFWSWAGAQFNTMWRDGKMAGLQYDKGNVGAALTVLGTSLFYMVGLQGANEAFWKDIVFHNTAVGEQDEDRRNKRMALRIPGQMLSYVPIIGPVGEYGLNKIMGGQEGLDVPAVQMMETLTNPMWEWAKEKYSGKESPHFWEDTAKSGAILFRYPQYFNTLAFNFIDNVNDRSEATWRDLFTRKTKH